MLYQLEKITGNFETLPTTLDGFTIWGSTLYQLNNDPKNKILILAKSDNNIVGFCAGDVATSEGLFLEVVKSWQGTGLAKDLIDIAKQSRLLKIKAIKPDAFLYWYRYAGFKRHTALKTCDHNLDIQKINNFTEVKPYLQQIKNTLPAATYNYVNSYCSCDADIKDMVWTDRNLTFTLAFLEHRLVGFLISDCLGIHYVYVDPLFRRQGIGTQLVISSGEKVCNNISGDFSFVGFWGRLLMCKFR